MINGMIYDEWDDFQFEKVNFPFLHVDVPRSPSYGVYEDCSNMNASIFITFVTYMLRQNGIRFYKGLYVTFKLASDLR